MKSGTTWLNNHAQLALALLDHLNMVGFCASPKFLFSIATKGQIANAPTIIWGTNPSNRADHFRIGMFAARH
jgi:hypothetical protein